MATTPNCQVVEAAVLAEFPDARFGRYNCRHIGSNPLRSWSQHAGSEPDRRYFANALDISHQAFGSTVTAAHTVWLRAVRAFITLNFGNLIDQMLGPGDNRAHANHIHVSTWPKMKSSFWYRPPCKGGTLIVIYEDGTKGDTFGDAVPLPPPPTLEDEMVVRAAMQAQTESYYVWLQEVTTFPKGNDPGYWSRTGQPGGPTDAEWDNPTDDFPTVLDELFTATISAGALHHFDQLPPQYPPHDHDADYAAKADHPHSATTTID